MKAHHLICLAMLPLTAMAIEPGPSSRFQAETENWLTLQANGRAASETPQKATPAERELAMKRWLESGGRAIPEFFGSESGGSSKGGKSQ